MTSCCQLFRLGQEPGRGAPLPAGTQGEHGCKPPVSGSAPVFLLQFLVEEEARPSAEAREVLEVPGARETLQTLGKWKSEHCREGQQNTAGLRGVAECRSLIPRPWAVTVTTANKPCFAYSRHRSKLSTRILSVTLCGGGHCIPHFIEEWSGRLTHCPTPRS